MICGERVVADMAKILITFNQVMCKDDTTGLGADEIYFAFFPSLIKKSGQHPEQRDLGGILSKRHDNVKTGRKYVPKLLNETQSAVIDVEDASRIVLLGVMYELDDGKHYERLKAKPELANAGLPRTDWKSLLKLIPTEDLSNVNAWTKVVGKALSLLVKSISEDDIIAKYPIAFDCADQTAYGFRELTFKGNGGEYKLNLTIEEL